MLIGQRHENVIFVLLQMTDCFQVTYFTAWMGKKNSGNVYNLLRADRWKTDYLEKKLSLLH